MLFDSHCHLDFQAFAHDRAEVVARARHAGIGPILLPGVAPSAWIAQREVARGISDSYLAFGVHPFWAHEVSPDALDGAVSDLEAALSEHGAVALGECGLDALAARRGGASLDVQVLLLERQLELARQTGLPVIVHCVRAHGQLLRSLERVGNLPGGGVLHAYTGPAELVERYSALGFYFGFGGAVTRPGFKRARRALTQVPLDRLLLETDAPDQPPAWRSGRNEPAELEKISHEIAQMRSMSRQLLAERTMLNAERLFGLAQQSR